MNNLTSIILTTILFTSCKDYKSPEGKTRVDTVENVDSLDIEEQDRETYFGYDTLLIKQYKSESGHLISLRGSKSKDLYELTVLTSTGKTKDFKIADNHYTASHSYVEWDNDNFIFVRFGCGTGCWAGKLLPLNRETRIKDYFNYIYADSIDNIIIYSDTTEYQRVIIENIKNNEFLTLNFNLCEQYNLPITAIDTVVKLTNQELLISFKNQVCKQEQKKVSLKQIKN